VEVGEAGVDRGPFGGAAPVRLDRGEKLDGTLRPDGPLAQQPADDARGGRTEEEGSEEIVDDVVVVAGVEGEVPASAVGDGADHVEGGVAVEGRDLDGDGG